MPPPQQARRRDGFPGQRLVIIPPALVSRAERLPVTRDLCVTHIGHFPAVAGHWVERKTGTPEHVLIGCLSGAGHCQLAGRSWHLGPGDTLFLPPRAYHLYHADPRAPWTVFWVHFRGLRAPDYLACLGVTSAAPVCAIDDPAVLLDAFEDTFRHVTHGFGDSALVGLTTAFARLLGTLRVHQARAGQRSRHTASRLLKVLAMMREDLARAWTLDELARAAALSTAHFSALCRGQTGMAPMNLLIRLRLQKAMALIQQGSHNVAEAAAAVGYQDPFYFSRQFSKHMGIPPSQCKHSP